MDLLLVVDSNGMLLLDGLGGLREHVMISFSIVIDGP